jgi:hypothetical protein
MDIKAQADACAMILPLNFIITDLEFVICSVLDSFNFYFPLHLYDKRPIAAK